MGGGQTKQADGLVVLITGCSDGGIGASMATEFAAAGCEVIATARSLSSMSQFKGYPNIRTMQLDVTDLDSVQAVVENVERQSGRIDILVNNAGVHCTAPVAEMPLSSLQNAINTNVYGPVALIQAVVPGMARRRQGKIVNIGSIVSYAYMPWAGGYAASKAAIHALTDALRMELRPFGLQVMLVLPGAIISNMGKNGSALIDNEVIDGLKFYRSWKDILLRRVMASQSGYSTPTQELSQKIVKSALQEKMPYHLAYGRLVNFFRTFYHLPTWVTDKIYCSLFDLNRTVSASEVFKED